jgi:alpha-amylase
MKQAKTLFLSLILSSFLIPFLGASGVKPAAEQLSDIAGTASVQAQVPAPSAQPYSLKAAQEWRAADQKYSSRAYVPPPQHRIDVPGSDLVMLQGFHWYADNYWIHPPNGWWGMLAQKAPDVAASGFNLVWFPPVSIGSYYPREWYNLDSQWGNGDALNTAIAAMHRGGLKVLADVVLNHRNGSTNWLDFKSPDWPSTVIVNDDEVWAQPAYANLPRSPYPDEGQGDFGCRDLDHRNPQVQEDTKVFMRWLKNTLGFDGWRYDMVKGYAPVHIMDYNAASSPVFTVGEFYDTDRQQVVNWIDGTDTSAGKANASSAFDFTTHYALVGAVENERYELLNDNGKPAGLIGWWPAKSVTFVENHDTSPRDPNFMANASQEYRIQRTMGYAYILTHPGIPCVFWPHFYDWGQQYHDAIVKLISIRKAAGITSTSPVQIIAATSGLYAATITGSRKQLTLKLGRNWGWAPGDGWTLETSGERYAVWSRPAGQ